MFPEHLQEGHQSENNSKTIMNKSFLPAFLCPRLHFILPYLQFQCPFYWCIVVYKTVCRKRFNNAENSVRKCNLLYIFPHACRKVKFSTYARLLFRTLVCASVLICSTPVLNFGLHNWLINSKSVALAVSQKVALPSFLAV